MCVFFVLEVNFPGSSVISNQFMNLKNILSFQAFFFSTVWPFSKNMFRRINSQVAELLWLEFVWLADWWAGVKVHLGSPVKMPDLLVQLLTFHANVKIT